MTDYITTRERFGRQERVLDVQRFTIDLADLLGGTYIKPNPDNLDRGERYASLRLDDCEIGITVNWRCGEKVNVSIGPADLNFNARGYSRPYGDEYRTPNATVSVTRPIERIAADIKRRVIEAGKAPIAKLRAHAEQLDQAAKGLVSTVDRLRKRYPALQVKVEQGATTSGSIYSNGEGPYLNGRVYADGSVSVERLGSLTADQFDRVMRALYGEGKR